MKSKSNILLLSIFLGGLLFTLLFWKEGLGLNLLIYSLFIIGVNYINTGIIKSQKFMFYAAAHLFAAILVVINNSDLSIIAYFISLLLFTGFSHYQQIRTIFTAVLATFLQFFTLPFNFFQNLSSVGIGKFNLHPILRFAKYVFIPVFIVTIFTVVYSNANEVFAHYLDRISISLSLFLTSILDLFFKDFNLLRFIHFCIGLILSAGLLLTFLNKNIGLIEQRFQENLERTRRNPDSKTIWYQIIETFTGSLLHKKLALKTEYITGIISFIALNILLLLINAIDIVTLWFGYKPSGNFSADLHEGTNALIFSIILAMAVILYFFRGNLNFYSKSKTLRFLAFAWMIQNLILIVSVFIRDGYYIEFYGLTHKRIGVLVFALLCIIGLATVYVKVAKQKTLFYLFKINGNIWFALLLGFSLINWDVFIVKYNLNYTNSKVLDPDYLLTLTDKVLPLLDKNRNKLQDNEDSKRNVRLNNRIHDFNSNYQTTTWLSLNYRDWQTHQYFIKNQL
jgi:hypothetical protein